MRNHKHIKPILILSVLIVSITLICIYCFGFSIIQGKYADINYIEVTVQDDHGNYQTARITNSDELLYLYDTVAAGANGNIEFVRLCPSHAYSKDSLVSINIVYTTCRQNVYVGYDNKLVYDLKPKFGGSERGFVRINEPDVAGSLREYGTLIIK